MDNIAYLGVDCSSKAIHAVWIDENENIILQQNPYFVRRGRCFGVSLSQVCVCSS